MFRSRQIIIRELCCSLLKLCYSIHNSIRICKRGVVAAYRVVCGCVVEQWPGVHIATAPQHIFCKYELNCGYCNITFHWQFYQHGSDYTTETVSVYVVVYMNTANEISFSIPSTWLQYKTTHHISTKLKPTR